MDDETIDLIIKSYDDPQLLSCYNRLSKSQENSDDVIHSLKTCITKSSNKKLGLLGQFMQTTNSKKHVMSLVAFIGLIASVITIYLFYIMPSSEHIPIKVRIFEQGTRQPISGVSVELELIGEFSLPTLLETTNNGIAIFTINNQHLGKPVNITIDGTSIGCELKTTPETLTESIRSYIKCNSTSTPPSPTSSATSEILPTSTNSPYPTPEDIGQVSEGCTATNLTQILNSMEVMKVKTNRDFLLENIPPSTANTVPRYSSVQADLRSIVNYAEGWGKVQNKLALVIIAESAQTFVGGTSKETELQSYMDQCSQ